MSISIKRVYDPKEKSDGTRVLIDRLWPRGVKKSDAHIDLWAKDISPSTELRQWFAHDPAKWAEFQKKYRAELKGSEGLQALSQLAKQGKITLIYAGKDELHTHAFVLQAVLNRIV